MRLTHLAEYKDKRKNREPMLKIRNKLFFYENIEDKHNIKSFDDLDKKLQALEIIKDNKINELELVWYNGMWFVFAPNCPRAIMYGTRKEDYDLLKKVFC